LIHRFAPAQIRAGHIFARFCVNDNRFYYH